MRSNVGRNRERWQVYAIHTNRSSYNFAHYPTYLLKVSLSLLTQIFRSYDDLKTRRKPMKNASTSLYYRELLSWIDH